MKIILADDHPVFRSGVRNLIQATDDLIVVGEACDGKGAVRLTEELNPDLVILDIRMPDMDGIEATRKIKERQPSTHVLILSMYKDDKSVFAAMKAGARGYLLKEADGAELLQSIRLVGSGISVFSPEVASRIMAFFEDKRVPPNPYFEQLTDREIEVLMLIAEGDSNARIAEKLQLSVKTIANNVTNILNKLHLADRNEARQLVRSYEEQEE